MDPRIKIWNLLHDGEITAVAGEGADTLTMFVSIPYLRRRLAPLGDSFVLTLSGVTRLVFRSFDGTASILGELLDDACTPEILSTRSESMPLTIETTVGRLELEYQGLSLSLDTGEAVEFEAIDTVAREYWADWNAKAAASREARGSGGPRPTSGPSNSQVGA